LPTDISFENTLKNYKALSNKIRNNERLTRSESGKWKKFMNDTDKIKNEIKTSLSKHIPSLINKKTENIVNQSTKTKQMVHISITRWQYEQIHNSQAKSMK